VELLHQEPSLRPNGVPTTSRQTSRPDGYNIEIATSLGSQIKGKSLYPSEASKVAVLLTSD